MCHAGWVSHPGVFTPGPGVEATDVATVVWYQPVTQAVCTHAQARRPPPPAAWSLVARSLPPRPRQPPC
eukprot:15136818-Alexandrium_andersonii.AAC.1